MTDIPEVPIGVRTFDPRRFSRHQRKAEMTNENRSLVDRHNGLVAEYQAYRVTHIKEGQDRARRRLLRDAMMLVTGLAWGAILGAWLS